MKGLCARALTPAGIAVCALLANAVLCVVFAEFPDTFLITTSVLTAALVMRFEGLVRRDDATDGGERNE